jgi:hypothetical protein
MALTPEERCAIGQQAREWRRRARSVYTKVAPVLYGAILMLLLMMFRDAQGSVWRSFLVFFIVALFIIATVVLFVKDPLQGESDPRPINLDELERKELAKLFGQGFVGGAG